VNVWEVVFLGIMAAALLAMAIAQMILAREAAKMVRQTSDTLQEFRRELQPLLAKLHRVTDDVGKAAQLARQQVERIDQIMGSTAERIEDTVTLIQDAIMQPIRHGTAILAGVRAALAAFRGGGTGVARPVREEDDALFIG
jgi:predicted PurR-regulated permease PerM